MTSLFYWNEDVEKKHGFTLTIFPLCHLHVQWRSWDSDETGYDPWMFSASIFVEACRGPEWLQNFWRRDFRDCRSPKECSWLTRIKRHFISSCSNGFSLIIY